MRNAFKRFKQAHQGHATAIKRVGRHPAFAIPFVTGSLLILLTVVGVVLFNGGSANLRSIDTHIVIINHDKIEQTVPTRAKTVSEVLKRFNIKLNTGDVVEPDLNTEIVTDNFRVN